jgi:hypothetical protein
MTHRSTSESMKFAESGALLKLGVRLPRDAIRR